MTDVNKLAEEYALQPLPPEVFTAAHAFRDHGGDEQTTGVVRVIERAAYLAGFRAALECSEVKNQHRDIKLIRDYVNPLHQKLLNEVIDAFDRLLEGVK